MVPRAVIIGGGPAGLSAAIVAHREGARVTVVEQRLQRSRPVWFDLAPTTLEEGADEVIPSPQEVLREWGLFELTSAAEDTNATGSGPLHQPAIRIVPDERGSGVVTIPCHMLERFLELSCRLLGITMLYGRSFDSICFDVDSGDARALLTPVAAASADPFSPMTSSEPPIDEPLTLNRVAASTISRPTSLSRHQTECSTYGHSICSLVPTAQNRYRPPSDRHRL